MHMRKILLALAIVPAVAACSGGSDGAGGGGGGGTGTAASRQYERLYNETLELRRDYPAGMAGTRAADIPLSGRAVYDGTATVRVGTADRLSLLGDAQINVDFARDTVNGRLGNFVGRRDNVAQAQNWAGQLQMDGDFNVSRSQYIRTGINGNLTQGGNTLRVNGTMDGNFHDDGTDRAEGLSAVMRSGGTIALNGRNYGTGTAATGIAVVAED